MSKFTKEEISLCKQVAERYRRPLENFGLVIGTHLSGEEFIGYFHKELTKERLMKARLDEVMVGFCETAKSTKELIPLWTISECLEFLGERGLYLLGLDQTDDYEFSCGFCETDDLGMRPSVENATWVDGETPLEACLKVVLAVLEESK